MIVDLPTERDVTADPAVAMCFSVVVDIHDLGSFTACEGLGVEVVLEQREEGGNNEYVHQLPVRMKYPNIKLTRALNTESALVAKWFASMAGNLVRTNAHITARTVDHEVIIAKWDLHGVIPVRWQGPSLNVDTAKAATETLELAHHGFLIAP